MLGSLIGAGASIIGGLLGNKAQKEANKQAEAQSLRQEALQKEFAQSGIQWKVQDAEKAGVHPLYALGAQTTSYQPMSVGGGASDFSWLGDAGQNIGRAIDATTGPQGRMATIALRAAEMDLQGKSLDNDIKRATLASALQTSQQAGNGPGIPSLTDVPGTSIQDGPNILVQNRLTAPFKSADHVEFGASPEVTLRRTKNGWAPVIPEQLSESFEQDWPGRYQWMARNKLVTDPSIVKIINRDHRRLGFRPYYHAAAGEYRYRPYPTYQRNRYPNMKGW